ncbi:MAG: DUF4230 domain-containing protein [Firmicutes bacterium]|nr:DUF4230 domain-containing protein [Bacillota bacterium]
MGASKAKVGFNPVKLVQLIIILIVILAMFIGIGYVFGRADRDKKEEISEVTLQGQIESISQLATVSYNYTDLGQYESSKEFYGTKVPFTTSKFILTYDGIIKAGIDMKDAQVSIEEKKIVVALPKAQILSHEIDETSMHVFDEKKSVFNPFTVEDYAAFYSDQKARVESKAIDKGLLNEAQSQGEKAIRGLIEPLLEEGWTLEII